MRARKRISQWLLGSPDGSSAGDARRHLLPRGRSKRLRNALSSTNEESRKSLLDLGEPPACNEPWSETALRRQSTENLSAMGGVQPGSLLSNSLALKWLHSWSAVGDLGETGSNSCTAPQFIRAFLSCYHTRGAEPGTPEPTPTGSDARSGTAPQPATTATIPAGSRAAEAEAAIAGIGLAREGTEAHHNPDAGIVTTLATKGAVEVVVIASGTACGSTIRADRVTAL
mmetsp:Transcript_11889/g.42526  ORF Transcript_11889/g.42526 Transcript_11889/m.42526 type:complete len:228 (+) Transcript_11889:93-776(+)